MKYALFGDIHDTDISKLENILDSIGVDMFICTGDFDSVYSIKQIIHLEKKFSESGKKSIVVPGNHDHALLYNEPLYRISGDGFNITGKSMAEYYRELIKDCMIDNSAYNYLENLCSVVSLSVNKTHTKYFLLDEDRFKEQYKTVVIHGAYAGNVSSMFTGGIAPLWTRLRTEDDYKHNFEIMKAKGDKIMIRGHDHHALYAFMSGETVLTHHPRVHGQWYILKPDRMHVINPGAVVNGNYAIIDTSEEEYPTLSFHIF